MLFLVIPAALVISRNVVCLVGMRAESTRSSSMSTLCPQQPRRQADRYASGRDRSGWLIQERGALRDVMIRGSLPRRRWPR